MSAYYFGRPAPEGYFDVEPNDLNRLPEGVRYIDVREPDEFDGDLGHLVHAELVPLGGLPQAARSWDRSTPLVLICRSGRRSASAAAGLCQLGFADVANLAGGMLAVRGRG